MLLFNYVKLMLVFSYFFATFLLEIALLMHKTVQCSLSRTETRFCEYLDAVLMVTGNLNFT